MHVSQYTLDDYEKVFAERHLLHHVVAKWAKSSKPAEQGVRYWNSSNYGLPISIIDSIWKCTDGSKVSRGTGSRPALRRL